MRVQLESGGLDRIAADTVVLPIIRRGETPRELPQGLTALDRRLGQRLSDALASGDFKANTGDRLAVYGPRGGGLVRTDATLNVRSFGGEFDHFRVRLPPGVELLTDDARIARLTRRPVTR